LQERGEIGLLCRLFLSVGKVDISAGHDGESPFSIFFAVGVDF
jgi:hypothetical protein